MEKLQEFREEVNYVAALSADGTPILSYKSAEVIEKEHRTLIQTYEQNFAKLKDINCLEKYTFINTFLQSAIRTGDFLNLSTVIYRTDKEIPFLPASIYVSFINRYTESSAIYYFYENDLPKSTHLIREVLSREAPLTEDFHRCLRYTLAMLLAAHLHLQAEALINELCEANPTLKNDIYIRIYQFVVKIEKHLPTDSILSELNDFEQSIPEGPEYSPYLYGIEHLRALLEKTAIPQIPTLFFPNHQENMLRIDLWAQAKRENKFYYNLLNQYWQKRKKVF